jgi:hypothetical protein
MPATYSISVGLPTEALRKQDINSVLLDIPDNTQKLISPKDVRDAFLSTWANAAFKQTIGLSSLEYIGIDSGNPENRDIKQKIFIGKRNYTGVDIMNNALLSYTNPTDIYFFNTKPDTITQSQTRIAILAGTNSSLYTTAPYIQAESNSTGTAINLDIVNPSIYSGPINIYSNTGRVAINGIVFPTAAETSASASNGRILKYSGTWPNGSLRWDEPTISISSIGVPGTPTNIYGSPSNVNGYSLEFVDPTLTTQTIGGIDAGSSFPSFGFNGIYGNQNWPMVEVIRKLLYPYSPPGLTIQLSNLATGDNYAEIGVTSSISFTYSITKYSENIDTYQIYGPSNTSPYTVGAVGTYSGLSFSSALPGDQTIVTFTYSVKRDYVSTPVTNNYAIQASDSSILPGFEHFATASLTFLSPFFTIFSSSIIFPMVSTSGFDSFFRSSGTRSVMSSGNKHIIPYPGNSQSVSFNCSGSGYLYFLVPYSIDYNYGILSMIKDPNGYIVYDSAYPSASSFTYSNSVVPLGGGTYLNYGNYRVYRTIGTCSYIGSGEFEFIF